MSDPNLDLGVGGGTPPLGPPLGTSLDEDEKALKRGNTMVLVLGAGAALLATIGLGAVLLLGGEDTEPYEAIGRQVNGMRTEHFDGFWTCALPGLSLEDLRSDRDLRQELTKRASRSPAAYAQLVRERCLVKLNEHEPGLRALIPPEDLASQIEALTVALTDLRGGWNEYLAELSARQGPYDEEAMAPQVNKIAKGWYDYRHAHGEINAVVGARLE